MSNSHGLYVGSGTLPPGVAVSDRGYLGVPSADALTQMFASVAPLCTLDDFASVTPVPVEGGYLPAPWDGQTTRHYDLAVANSEGVVFAIESARRAPPGQAFLQEVNGTVVVDGATAARMKERKEAFTTVTQALMQDAMRRLMDSMHAQITGATVPERELEALFEGEIEPEPPKPPTVREAIEQHRASLGASVPEGSYFPSSMQGLSRGTSKPWGARFVEVTFPEPQPQVGVPNIDHVALAREKAAFVARQQRQNDQYDRVRQSPEYKAALERMAAEAAARERAADDAAEAARMHQIHQQALQERQAARRRAISDGPTGAGPKGSQYGSKLL